MYHIILNPAAGKAKRTQKNLQIVEEKLKACGLEYTVHSTEEFGGARATAKKVTEEGGRKLIVFGGDGTLHDILNGLQDPSVCELGLIPSGTGNDFAECIGAPLDAAAAIDKIIGAEAKPVDYLEVGGERCMNVAGIGMDVDVLERCLRGKRKGKMKYFYSLLRSLFAFKGYDFTMECEGKTVEVKSGLIAAVCNGTQFGGGIRICPDAKVDDGKLNVVIVDNIKKKTSIIKAFLKLMKGKIAEYPTTTHFLCDSVRFVPKNPCTVQLDGELYPELEYTVTVKTGLKFFY